MHTALYLLFINLLKFREHLRVAGFFSKQCHIFLNIMLTKFFMTFGKGLFCIHQT